MGVDAGPGIVRSGLVFAMDSASPSSISPLGATGFSGAQQLVRNLITRTDSISSLNDVRLTGVDFYTAFAIDYPESSYGGDAVNRQGITPGYNVRAGSKTYDASRALHLWVWNNDTQAWVADSYFTGLRLNGHCYDSYTGYGDWAVEVGRFVTDYNKIKKAFPNCTYIVAGSHRDSGHTTDKLNILKDLGAPSNVDSLLDSDPEWILVGKPGLGAGNAFGWVFENYPTNSAQVAHLNFRLPVEGNTNLQFDGVDDYISLTSFTGKPTTQISCEAWIKPTKSSVGTGTHRGGAVSSTNSMYLGIINSVDGGNTFAMHWANQTSNSRLYNWNGSVPNNSWSHLVGTYDGSTSRAYINGTQVDSWSQTGTIPDATYVIGTYGGALTDGVHNFNGLIAVARIYNRGLTSSEVVQNFNAQRDRFGL